MFDILPIALPAVVVVIVAVVLVRRERVEHIIDLTQWDDVAVVPVTDEGCERHSGTRVAGGALIDPDGATLGARIRDTVPEARPVKRVRIHRRDRPLVGVRSDR